MIKMVFLPGAAQQHDNIYNCNIVNLYNNKIKFQKNRINKYIDVS